jgi:HAD superfamily hydrolase (TIGR01549 family)
MKTLLFDLDGTLVNSIPLWIEANVQSLKTRGATMDSQTFLIVFYQPGLHHSGILEKCGLPTVDNEAFYTQRNDFFTTLLEEKIEWLGNAGDVLKQCAQKTALGLMTGATTRSVKAIDKRLHLSDVFQEIVTYDDTGTRMKPDPYGLELIIQRLGVDATSCVYIGDQLVDVLASQAAGMTSCLIPTQDTAHDALDKADMVLANIEGVLQFLED